MSTPDTSQAQTAPRPGLLGAFGLLTSPIFLASSVLVLAGCGLFYYFTSYLVPSIAMAVGLELVVSLVSWQFLWISARLEHLNERTADTVRLVEARLAELKKLTEDEFGSGRNAHGFTHKLLRQMSGDQSRSVQMGQELKNAIRTLYEQLAFLSTRFDQWEAGRNTLNTDLSEIQAAIEAQHEELPDALAKALDQAADAISEKNIIELNRVRDSLGDSMTANSEKSDRSLQHVGAELQGALAEAMNRYTEASLEHCEKLQAALSSARDDISAFHAALIEHEYPGNDIAEALKVATAVDRLNLEMRRQLLEMRRSLG